MHAIRYNTSAMSDTPPSADNRLQAFPEGLPSRLCCAAGEYEFVRQFKHDFFAATGLYRRIVADRGMGILPMSASPGAGTADTGKMPVPPTDQVVLKIQRRRPFFGLPLGWLGAWLTRHEATIYRELADVPGVPDFVDFFGPTGFIHAFMPGRPLDRREPVSDTFFDELAELLRAIHARGLAYVDLNKRQNILVDAAGRPGLIDFQISFRLGPRRGELPRAILALLQRADWYHFAKHKRRCRPDLMTPADIEQSYRPDGWGRLHRFVSKPYFTVRRRVLDRMGLPRGDQAEG